MRTSRVIVIVAVLAATLLQAQSGTLRGVEATDINRSVDACSDFFEFANGKWRAENPIPAAMPRWSRRWAAGETAKDRLHDILDQVSAASGQAKGSVEQLIGDFYGACTDEAAINSLGAKPLMPLLAEIDQIRDVAAVQRMIGRFHAFGIRVPFQLVGGSDNHKPTDVIAQIYAGGLGMPDRDYYVKPDARFKEAREKYVTHVANMFRLAGVTDATAFAEAASVVRMETRFAEASLDNVALRDPSATDHKMSFGELQRLAPSFNWAAYFKSAGLPPAALNVAEPRFLQAFSRDLTAEPVAQWKAYLKWHLLNSAAPSLSDAFVREDFAFNGAFLYGAAEMKPRWKRCVELTDSLLGEALGKKYVEKYFPAEAKARMQELVKNLLAAMRETIQGLDWMSADTKGRAAEKLATFNPKIGYPDRWKDYSEVPISRTSFWEDVVAGRTFNVRDDLSTIGKPTDRGRWGMTPPTSNAYYNALLNEIVFPAGILQPPAFDVDAEDAINYGSIGVVIGHEISHGFDDEGAQFDAQGRLNNWWTPEDQKRFEEKTACVARQFDGYFIEPNIHHNGKLVLGESIGDLAGAKIAYLAFKKAQQQHAAPTLDGFSPDQQFFIAWGQWRGDEIRPETQRLIIQGDPHPIAQYRVIGALSNLPAFGQALNRQAGSAMVRTGKDRCEVW